MAAENTAAAGDRDFNLHAEEQDSKAGWEMERMDIDAASNDTVKPTNDANGLGGEPRPEAVNLRGVDNLSSAEVLAFATSHFSTSPMVDWVDDTSCNLVYADAGTASKALEALSVSADGITPSTLRIAHPLSTNADARLQVRIAYQNDKKVQGARVRSKYYLFHGDPHEDRDRTMRREADGRRPRERRRSRGRRRSTNGDVDLFPERARSASPLRNNFRSDKAPAGPRSHHRRHDDDLFPSKISNAKQVAASKPLDERIGPLPSRRHARTRAEDLFR